MNNYPFLVSILKKLSMLILCIGVCLLMTGCAVYHAGGGKSYDVKASTEEGVRFVNVFDIKLISKGVYGFFWTDFYVSKDCVYAMDVKVNGKDNIFQSGTIRYKPIKEEYVERLGLEPDFSWWDKYGFLIIAVAMYLFSAWFLREMTETETSWRHAALDICIIVCSVLPILILVRLCGMWF